mgnify:CR=1 FL=1
MKGKTAMLENLSVRRIWMLNSSNKSIVTTTCECICRNMTAALLPVMSHGLTQCFTPLAAYEFYCMTNIQPLGRGMMNAPLQNP